MDLSFARFDKDVRITALPPDLAVLMVGISARQAASPTAIAASRLSAPVRIDALFAPLAGAFNLAAATCLESRNTHEAGVYLADLA